MSSVFRIDRCPGLLKNHAVPHSRVCIHAFKPKAAYAVAKRGTENKKTEGFWLERD